MRFSPPIKYLPVLALLLPVPAQAAEWWTSPDISLKSGYNDNVRYSSLPHDTVWETNLTAATRFGVAQENQGLSGRAAVKLQRFSGGSGRESSELLDREDYFLTADAYRLTELNVFRANVGYVRDSTLDSQLGETGLVSTSRATREKESLGASWARTLTEKMQFNLGYRFSNVDFIDAISVNRLVPYKTDAITAAFSYQYSPRASLSLSASSSSFKPGSGFDSNTLNIQAGISGSLSETLSISFLAGQRQTTSDSLFAAGFCIGADPGASFPECSGGFPVITGSDTKETVTSGLTYNVSLTKALNNGSLGIVLTRTTSPGLNGQLLDRNRLLLSGEHRFTERLRTSLRVEYSENETIVNVVGRETPNDVTQKFFRITPRISWQWLREWTIDGEYRYGRNENRALQTATQNAVYLTLSYRPTRLSISR